jgi:WD40 repeat protein
LERAQAVAEAADTRAGVIPANPLPEPGDSFGAYRLIEKLGEGGMGTVYLAEQERPIARRVALKVIKLGLGTQEVVARFESERQALARMDHPNIAQVYDAGTSQLGRPYFVMEYVPGTPITDYCDQKRLGTRGRLKLFLKLCEGVHHAHQKSVIHRDIKPSNVLVMERDGEAVPKVIDFGLAKAVGKGLAEETLFTQAGVMVGTPEYMSPEQASAGAVDIDTRSDIYSLGLLLYELLVGATPFDARTLRRAGLDEMRRVIREEEPPKLTARLQHLAAGAPEISERRNTDIGTLRQQVRGDLEWITAKALQKERDRRYAAASELGADIERHLRDEPVTAGPASALYLARKFMRKNRVKVLAAAAVLICLLAGLTASSALYFRAERQRQRAERQGYAANLAAANMHVHANEFEEARARLLLSPPRLRAWEWRHVWASADNSLATISSSRWEPLTDEDWRTGLSISPDGSRLFWHSQHSVEAFDGASYRRLATYGPFNSIVAMSSGGEKILCRAAQKDDPRLHLVETASGRTLATLAFHHPRTAPFSFSPDNWFETYSAAFTADGQRIATGSPDGTLQIWDGATGRLLLTMKAGVRPVFSLAFSGDGKRLVSGSVDPDNRVRVWNALSGALLHVLEGHRHWVWSLAVSRDGSRIVSGSGADRTARIWDGESGRLLAVLGGYTSTVSAAAFSPDDQRIVTTSYDRSVRVWRAATGDLIASLAGDVEPLTAAGFTPDGTRIVAASYTGRLQVWDATTYGGTIFGQTTFPVQWAAMTHDGKRLLGGCYTGLSSHPTWIWETATGAVVCGLDGTRAAAFSPDGARVVSGPRGGPCRQPGKPLVYGCRSNSEEIVLWDAASGAMLRSFAAPKSNVESLDWGPDGRWIAGGYDDGLVQIRDAASGEVARAMTLADPVEQVAFSPDGRRLAAASRRAGRNRVEGVHLWDAGSGALLFKLGPAGAQFTSVAFSPDGRRLAAAGSSEIWIWDTASGKQLAALSSGSQLRNKAAAVRPYTLLFSTDGKRLFAGMSKGAIVVWDSANYEPLLTLYGHEPSAIAALFMARDDSRLFSHANETFFRAWDTRSAYSPPADEMPRK